MRRITVKAAGVVALTAAVVSYGASRALRGQEPAGEVTRAKVAEPDMVTASIVSRPIAPPAKSQYRATAVPSVAIAAPSSPSSPSLPRQLAEQYVAAGPLGPTCPGNPDALGLSRVVEIDTAGGPGFGFEHFKAHDFLEMGEIVLTFDDGPWPGNTPAVLAALAAQCVKATFFPIGKHAMWHPEVLKQVAAQGHAVGSHTWSHVDLSMKSPSDAKEEIEKGISAVAMAAGRPLAPFFRFPAVRHTPELMAYLAERNIGAFSTDLVSFRLQDEETRASDSIGDGEAEKMRQGHHPDARLPAFDRRCAARAADTAEGQRLQGGAAEDQGHGRDTSTIRRSDGKGPYGADRRRAADRKHRAHDQRLFELTIHINTSIGSDPTTIAALVH
jgi:peptidoglycan/xylan/chitin deacetylase (PgdA/CDA1 family)